MEKVAQDKQHMERMATRAEEVFLNIRIALLPMDIVQQIAPDVETFHKLMAEREEVIFHAFSITNKLFEMGSEGKGKDITDEELQEMGKCAEEAAVEFVNRILDIQNVSKERRIKLMSEDVENAKREPSNNKKEKSDNAVRHAGYARRNKKKSA